MNKLILIDGLAILHRAFHAIPPLTNKKGEHTNAIYGLVSMLLRVVSDLKPTHIMFCMDEKAPTFRHKEFKEYQSHRPQMDNFLEGQISKARDVVSSFNIPIYSKVGFEADDVIGTIAEEVKKKEKDISEILIVTGDRDILQLVDDKVKIYMPVMGLSGGKLFGEKETVERMGVAPNLICEYKGLVGDPSDNYKGVPGVGPKTAILLLDKYKSIREIYKNLDKIDKKVAEKLKKGKASAFVSLRLATIVRDVPIKFDLKKASDWSLYNKKVVEEFSDLGFKTLAERVKKAMEEKKEENQMSLL